MLEFSCPKCGTANRAPSAQRGQTVKCVECKLALHLNCPDGGDAASGLGKTDRQGPSPVLAGVGGGLAGLFVATGLVGAWFFLGRAPEARPDVQPIEGWATAAQPGTHRQESVPAPQEAPPESKAMSSDEIYQRLLKSVCWIVTNDGEGSGTLLDRTARLVLTNEHVANRRSTRVRVVFPMRRNGQLVTESKYYRDEVRAGNAINATVLDVDVRRDLTLLQLDRLPPDVQRIRVSTRSPKPGQTLHTVGGNPQGNTGQWTYRHGKVSQVVSDQWTYRDGLSRAGEVIASDVPINPGDSGGGVVNDRCLLVGVNNAVRSGRSNTLHIDITEVNGFVRNVFQAKLKRDWLPVSDEAVVNRAAERKVEELLDALKSADEAEERRKVIVQLGNMAEDGCKAIPDLVDLARDQDQPERIHQAAIEALEAIGEPKPDQVKNVYDALLDKQAPLGLRRYAAGAMAMAAVRSDEVGDALILALRDDDAIVRRKAANALVGVKDSNREKATVELIRLLQDPMKEVREAAYQTLIRFGSPEPEKVEVDKEKSILTDDKAPVEARRYSCFLLVGEGIKNGAMIICDVLRPDIDWGIARLGLALLYRDKPKTREAGVALYRLLNHKDAIVRGWATEVLIEMVNDSQNSIPRLLPAILIGLESNKGPFWDGLRKRLETNTTNLAKDVPNENITKESFDSIKPLLGSSDILVRRLAAYMLASLGSEGASAAPLLRTALKKETVLQNKLEILVTFAYMGPEVQTALGSDGERFLAELSEMARDARSDTRDLQTCAAVTLWRVAPGSTDAKKVLPTLAKALLLRRGTRMKEVHPRTPIRELENRVIDPTEYELQQRAKEVLAKGGKPAADALALAFRDTFAIAQLDTPNVGLNKAHARKAAFELFVRLGADAKLPAVRAICTNTVRYAKKTGELGEVIAAAKEAATAIGINK